MRFSRTGFVILLVCLFSSIAAANSFSFTGTFLQDDDMQIFLFSAPSNSVELRTWGYAGGVNANGDTIANGGFDPVLSLFDATGGFGPLSPLIEVNDDGAANTDPATGNASDSLLFSITLDPLKIYALVLTQSDNLPNGGTFGDGFLHTGEGNFTAAEFGCGGGPFCQNGPFQRNGQWAVDITGVGSASVFGATATPEPASFLLFGLGIGGLALGKKRLSGARRAR